MIVGCITLITVNTLIFGFVTWLPTFFVHGGRTIAQSFGYSLIISIGAPIGSAIAALTSDSWGRKPTIVGASLLTILVGSFYPFIENPLLLSLIGFVLMIPIYVLVTVCFAVYIPELFPTEVRLRLRHLQHLRPRRHHRHPIPGSRALPPLRSRRRHYYADSTTNHRNHRGSDLRHRTQKSPPRRNKFVTSPTSSTDIRPRNSRASRQPVTKVPSPIDRVGLLSD
jgi:hypothetical protein